MDLTTDAKMPWVIAELNARPFALNCAVVREMVIMPEVCAVPGMPDYVRGVINLRGRVTPLVDLRRRLGLRSLGDESEELCALMEQRAQDHRNWLDELEAAVKERRKFVLGRDPHQCAFGKWYDNFKTDNILLSGFLKKFDGPHKKIHALANEVEQLIERGCGGDADACAEKAAAMRTPAAEKAAAMFNQARSGVLSTMLKLFADFQQVIRETRREIAVVLHGLAGTYAVSVDSVASVERLAPADMEELAGKGLERQSELVTSVAKRAKGGGLVLILAPDSILDPGVQAGLIGD